MLAWLASQMIFHLVAWLAKHARGGSLSSCGDYPLNLEVYYILFSYKGVLI